MERRAELPPTGPSSAAEAPAQPPSSIDLEKFLGRYAAWGFAALMILLGVGTLLNWAIRSGLFGPPARVALSSVVAIALAAGGYVVRQREIAAGRSGRFGNATMGLGLGVLDLVALQIGPKWHMVPPAAALVVAIAGAGALTRFGLLEADELLAAVGSAGLYLAPFITSSSDGSPVLLATYITAVTLTLFRFVEQDSWTVACTVIRMGSLASIVALMFAGEGVLAAVVAVILAVAAMLAAGPLPPRLQLIGGYITAALIATALAAWKSPARIAPWTAALVVDRHTPWLASIAVLIAVCASSWFALQESRSGDFYAVRWKRPLSETLNWSRLSPAFTLVLPVLGVLAAAIALPGNSTSNVLWLGALSGMVALAVALTSASPLAGEYLVTAFVLLWAGALSYYDESVRLTESALLCVAVIALGVLARRPGATFVRGVAFLSTAAVTLGSASRTFAAEAQHSLAHVVPDTLLMAGAWAVFVTLSRVTAPDEAKDMHAVRTVAPWVAGLILARHLVAVASGPYDTLALTCFYAASGLGLIILGRRRDNLGLRRAGLALSLYAPFRALATTSEIANVGLRVGLYFIAGAFMLLVAFLYRRRGRTVDAIMADLQRDPPRDEPATHASR